MSRIVAISLTNRFSYVNTNSHAFTSQNQHTVAHEMGNLALQILAGSKRAIRDLYGINPHSTTSFSTREGEEVYLQNLGHSFEFQYRNALGEWIYLKHDAREFRYKGSIQRIAFDKHLRTEVQREQPVSQISIENDFIYFFSITAIFAATVKILNYFLSK